MNYIFKKDDITRIRDRFGEKFYNDISESIDAFIVKWRIDALELVESFSANLVFKGFSKNYGPIVMKFAPNLDEFTSEVNALRYFKGSRMCKLIDIDRDNRVLLEENILPGTELIKEKKIEHRLDVFCDLYNQLHYEKDTDNCQCDEVDHKLFKSYKDWIYRITDYISQEENWHEVAFHMKRAKELYKILSHKYSNQRLLHGDFHYYNILKSENSYKVIDPKGVIGHPIFDIPRYMLNEFWDEENKLKIDETMAVVFDIFSQKLNISRKVLSELLYIEGTMAICWCVESGADIVEKVKYLDILDKLQAYMCQYR
ncbi:aminoglycoside phosphotransferase family protein [Fusibacter ferrireducens]|uniref:Aminoglycoside resistance protein n=1 Tax=Fusibacter ferrireducens TaxID=2785058 RepID=A0ABR9ZUD8_9FIRM|nr:aminoglycoside phosphotransferase family protein [Fusibacter ferrireducens]MBF4693768.1 aminoglycoside resistance protein [Fusibacter ferrireducens]